MSLSDLFSQFVLDNSPRLPIKPPTPSTPTPIDPDPFGSLPTGEERPRQAGALDADLTPWERAWARLTPSEQAWSSTP